MQTRYIYVTLSGIKNQIMTAKNPAEAKDVKASMSEYLSGSLKLLSAQPVPDDGAIHDVRVLMKKHRAAVRLVRPLLDETVYRREYLAGRETGQIMSLWRETAVLRKTVRALKKNNRELFVRLRGNEKIQELLRKPYSTWDQAGERAKAVGEVGDRLKKALYRLRFLGLNDLDMRMVLGELEKSHLTASAAYLACRNRPSVILLHQFRKKSKTFMYQLLFIRHLSPQRVKQLEKKLATVTENLGKCNDLAQIMTLTGYKLGAEGNTCTDDELAIVIRDRQDRYLAKVWPAAYRIFAPGKKLQDILGISF